MSHAKIRSSFLGSLGFCCALCAGSPAGAITLDRSLAGSAGGWVAGGSYALGFSVGEPAAGFSEELVTPSQLWAGFWSPSDPIVVGVEEAADRALEAGLRAWPNPFADAITLCWAPPAGWNGGEVRASIFDPRGRRVREFAGVQAERGAFRFEWDGRDEGGADPGAGLYFCRIEAGEHAEVRRLARIR